MLDALKEYRKKYKDKEYFTTPRFDKVGITTLFTFYWDITIDTINFAKQLGKKQEDVMVGGIISSLLADEVYNVLFNNLQGSQVDKTRTAIKDKLKDGLIDVLNFYIHYPQMIDASQLIISWYTMKLFVIRCLSI